ncbi:MAG: DedA family protein [Nanoarchaeota archaeon]
MITEILIEYITQFISAIGYPGIFILMMLESMVAPVPAEAVMPFAGFLIADGKFTFANVMLISTLGSLVGSLISYYTGYFGGQILIRKFGKYIFLEEYHLDWTIRFFEKYGSSTILISRFIPVVRHLISIPAGYAKMKIIPFLIYTLIGAITWNGFLVYVGFKLGENWNIIEKYTSIVDIIVIGLITAGIVLWIVLHIRLKAVHKTE